MQGFPKFLIASPSFHGGRGALPSAGGHPADLTFLAGVKQLEHSKHLPKFTTPEHLKCSLLPFQGIKTPIYYISSQSLFDNTPFGGLSNNPEEEESILDTLFLAQWEERMWKGCFGYDVSTSKIKIISGRVKFLAQLNEKGSMDSLSKSEENKVCHQRDLLMLHSINHQEDLLFCIASTDKAKSEFIPSAAVPNGAILIILNATPVEYGHVFLVPCDSNGLYLDATSLEMMLRVAGEMNNYSFRLFCDCSTLGASHMYFQACYFPDHLSVELMPVDIFFSDGLRGIHISTVTDYPIKTILFEHTSNIKIMVEEISEISSYLQEKNIPHNFLISDCGKRIFLFLQKLGTSCNLSAWECGGYFLFRSKYEFDQVTENDILKHLSAVSIDDEGFEAVKQLCGSVVSKPAI